MLFRSHSSNLQTARDPEALWMQAGDGCNRANVDTHLLQGVPGVRQLAWDVPLQTAAESLAQMVMELGLLLETMNCRSEEAAGLAHASL